MLNKLLVIVLGFFISNTYAENRAHHSPLESEVLETAGEFHLLDLLKNRETKEVIFLVNSFSHDELLLGLCREVKDRNLKITVITSMFTVKGPMEMKLASCLPRLHNLYSGKSVNRPVIVYRDLREVFRGLKNGLILINPNSSERTTVIQGVKNLSKAGLEKESGAWTFSEYASENKFVQSHLRLLNGLRKKGSIYGQILFSQY